MEHMGSRGKKKKLALYLHCENVTLFAIFMFFLVALPVSAETAAIHQYEYQLQEMYNWAEYPNWDCVEMTAAVSDFFDQQGLYTQVIYGHRYEKDSTLVGHVWLVVMIEGTLYEFESTLLQFMDVTGYTIDFVN
jgi:hypothetical protein